MASKTFKQEMPPKGGFGPIEWSRRVPKPAMNGFLQFGLMGGFMGFWWTVYFYLYRQHKRNNIELNDAMISIEPLLQAEKNRAFLKRLRENRDYENELMKDYPGWVTGTLMGEPVFHNKRGRYFPSALEEFYAHTSDKAFAKKQYPKLYHFY